MIRKQRSIAVENLVVSASIGIYPHEHEAPQRVRLSFDAEVALPDSLSDDFSNVLSYEVFVNTARAMMLEAISTCSRPSWTSWRIGFSAIPA